MSGTIQSPYYPHFYPYNLRCRYLIKNWYPAARITLRFLQFSIEYYEECKKDYVKIYNGNSTESPILGFPSGYCGFYPTLPVLTSTGNAVLVIFVSDDQGNTDRPGFDLSYSIKGKFHLLLECDIIFLTVKKTGRKPCCIREQIIGIVLVSLRDFYNLTCVWSCNLYALSGFSET